jgi:hypothetical protein
MQFFNVSGSLGFSYRNPFDMSVISLENMAGTARIPPFFRMWEIVILMLIGVVGGVIGATFVGLTTMLNRLRKSWYPEGSSNTRRLIEVTLNPKP